MMYAEQRSTSSSRRSSLRRRADDVSVNSVMRMYPTFLAARAPRANSAPGTGASLSSSTPTSRRFVNLWMSLGIGPGEEVGTWSTCESTSTGGASGRVKTICCGAGGNSISWT
eukprot:scaffold295659_cov30-Tisochrysis_lutea.AAC.1